MHDKRFIIIKECPDCGKALVVRANRNTGEQFIGCSMWPDCAHTEKLPESLRMRLAGAPVLPGFE